MSTTVLTVNDLSVRFGTTQALRGVDLTVCAGEWCAVLGPNGSGKTTLLRCVSGQITPIAGTVDLCGLPVHEGSGKAKRALGYAHAPEQLPGLLTGRQCLEVYAAAHELPDVPQETLGLAARLRLSAALDQWVSTYSLGMRQKLSLLLALISDPALIVLDEVFNGLDPPGALLIKHELRTRLAERSAAVMLATHALDVVLKEATRAVLLLEGRLVRSWQRSELEALRLAGPESLEVALAEACQPTHA